MADDVIGDIIGNVLDEADVPDRHIMQSCVAYACVLFQATGKGELAVQSPYLHLAGEADIFYIVKSLLIGDQYVVPIFGRTAVLFEKLGSGFIYLFVNHNSRFRFALQR